MAGVMDEFDEATPMKRSYCRSLTEEEYEQQASVTTEKALQDLMRYLDLNSDKYSRILKRKKREEVEENGLLSYMKVRPTLFGSRRIYNSFVDTSGLNPNPKGAGCPA